MRKLAKFVEMIQVSVRGFLAYRGAVWFGVFTNLVSIVIYYSLWSVIFRDHQTIKGFSFAQMTTYVILSRILAAQFSQGINRTLSEWIYDGQIAMELLRPTHIMFSLFSQRAAGFLYFIVMNALPTTLISVLLFGCLPPAGGGAFLLFLLSVVFSIALMFFLEFMVGLVSFYTMNYYGLAFAKDAIFSVLSGGVVPLFLFPDAAQRVFSYLPFPYLVSLPIHIYLGTMSRAEVLAGILTQLGWIVGMGVLAYVFFARAVKKVVVQGG